MKTATSLASRLGAMALVAGSAYFLDPRSGRRRRAIAKDRLRHGAHRAEHTLEAAGIDLDRRARGRLAELRARIAGEDVDDDVVRERVRAKLGHVCSHPGAIEVRCEGGRVGLKGPILKREVPEVRSAIRRVRGVRDIADELEVHEKAAAVSSLQGGVRRRELFELRQRHWSPGTRLLAGTFGAALVAIGLGVWRRSSFGALAAILGSGVLLRSVTNLDLKRLTGVGAGRRAIDIKKSITVDAKVEEVFALFSVPERFPRFMSHVEEVVRNEDGTYHWKVQGPAKIAFRWDTIVTEFVPNEVVAWKSREGASVENAGVVRFEQRPDGRTTLHVRLSYNPPAGAIGHEFAKLLVPRHRGMERLGQEPRDFIGG